MSPLLTLGPEPRRMHMAGMGWTHSPEPSLTLQGTWAPSSAGPRPLPCVTASHNQVFRQNRGDVCAQEGSRSHPGHHVL